MTDALNTTVPAGWYPDPWGSTSKRWWDGSAWTESLQPPADAPPVAPIASEEPAVSGEPYTPVAVRSTYEPATPLPSRRALRELTDAPASDSTATDPSTVTDASQGTATAVSLPPLTQAPEFSPEPVSALPPPVWTEPEAEPVAEPEPEPAAAQPAEPLPVAEAPVAEALAAVTPAAEIPVGEVPVAETPEAPAAPVSSPVPVVAKPSTASADPDDGWAASLTRWEDVETTSAPPDAMPIFGDAPPVSYSQRAVRYQPLHGRTSPVWLIVFMPVLQAVAVVGSLFLFPGLMRFDAQWAAFIPADPMTFLTSARDWILFALAPLTIAFFVFTLVLGFQDRSRLRLLGHDQTASPWWIVLSPLIYLIVRSVRVRQSTGRRGSGPLTTYICLYIAPGVALFIAQTVISSLYGAIPV